MEINNGNIGYHGLSKMFGKNLMFVLFVARVFISRWFSTSK